MVLQYMAIQAFRLSVCATFCAALAACGGGSGSTTAPVAASTGSASSTATTGGTSTSGSTTSTTTTTGTGTGTPAGVTTKEVYTYGDGNIVDTIPDAAGIDGQNNLYVASINYRHVTKITPAGLASTFIGNSGDATVNYDIGTPMGMAVNQGGDVYLANGNGIVEVTAAGQVSTPFQYSDVYAALPGTYMDQRTHQDSQIAVDNAGNLYVVVACSGIVRKVTPAGVMSTLATNLSVQTSQFFVGGEDGFVTQCTDGANGIALDAAGNVYVADTYNHMIVKITAAGQVIALAGSPTTSGLSDGIGAAASFTLPWHLSIDTQGNVYVSDSALIRKITPQGMVTTILGGSGSGTVAVLPNSNAPQELGAELVVPLGASSLYAVSVYSTDGWGVVRFDNLP